MIRQWDDAVEALRQRDDAILLVSEQFAAKKAELRQMQSDLDGQVRTAFYLMVAACPALLWFFQCNSRTTHASR